MRKVGVDGRKRRRTLWVVVVVVDCDEEEEYGVVSTRMMEWRERGRSIGKGVVMDLLV